MLRFMDEVFEMASVDGIVLDNSEERSKSVWFSSLSARTAAVCSLRGRRTAQLSPPGLQ